MPTILDPELQCPLLHHGLVHLYLPAVIWANGRKMWYKEGVRYDSEN
jgi:hypothetical protein